MNAERTSRGLRKLRSEPTLARVARAFAREMGAKQFFDHESPAGSTLASRVKATRYLRGASGWSLGENIAWGTGDLATPRSIVKGWMDSPPHRANLLSSRFTEVGIGTGAGGGSAEMNPDRLGTSYVTDFGQRSR
jgi:uncharacterized protein YkwD